MDYSIDPNDALGKVMISAALVAKSSGQLVWVSGDGICSVNPVVGVSSEGLTNMDLKQ